MAWVQREESSNPEEARKLTGSPDGLSLILTAIAVAGVLALVATWFIVAYFPVPDDDAIYLGLIGFHFVLVLDFFLIYHELADSKLRQGRVMPAIQRSLSLFLLGLLVAAIVGLLPWLWSQLWHWLLPFAPWLPDALEKIGLLALVLNLIVLWKRRRASKVA